MTFELKTHCNNLKASLFFWNGRKGNEMFEGVTKHMFKY